MEIALISDIGGSNCRIYLIKFSLKTKEKETLLYKKYLTCDYKSLEDVLDIFLKEHEC